MNCYCNPEWFDTYKFLAYFEQEDGVYCLYCIRFSDLAQKCFSSSKTYHDILYELGGSYKLFIQPC